MGKVIETVAEGKAKDGKIKAYCNRCTNETNHLICQSMDVVGEEFFDEDKYSFDWEDSYQIIQCQGCDLFSFRHLNYFSEAREWYSPDDFSDGTTTYLYPARTKNALQVKDYFHLSPPLRRIYRETIDCFNGESFTLCAAGLRAVLEGICHDHGVVDGVVKVVDQNGKESAWKSAKLDGKIFGLAEKGILTEKQASMLHEHRFLGNDAVHELSQPSSTELKLAIEIIEHIFDSIYEMPEKANELRVKRLVRAQSVKPGVK